MTLFPPLFRRLPLVSFVDLRTPGTPIGGMRPRPTPLMARGAGRRELAVVALVAAAELGIACGYAFLIALVCSALLGSAP